MRIFLSFFLMLALASATLAGIIEPRDESRVFSELVVLRGISESPGTLEVNGIPLRPASDNSFSCGLILDPGKNLAEVNKGSWRQPLRLLRFLTFADVESLYEGQQHWARKAIIYLATMGIIEGYPDGNFYPGNPITRGELATWLVRTKSIAVPALTADVFFDVPKEHWRAPYIKAAVDAGIMEGYSNNSFGIDEPLSRREAAEVIIHSEGLSIIEKIQTFFLDVPSEEKGAAPIYTAREKGLVIGVSKEVPIFDPDRALTRAEAAVLISRFDSVQRKAAELDDFQSSFEPKHYCRINVPPEIISFIVNPDVASVNQSVNLKLRAKIGSRKNFLPLSKVKVDLSQLGGVPDAEMFDNGTGGDEVGGDGVYSLNLIVTLGESSEKIVRVMATDQLGWEAKKEARLIVSQ